MRIMLLGAPGSGKGTQAKLLIEKHNVPQISTGDLLRAAISAGTELGKQAGKNMDDGQLVPDELVLGMIKERLAETDAQQGFILDGFPRTIIQAQNLDAMLESLDWPLNAVFFFDVDPELVVQRISGRRTCEDCGQMYNIFFFPSKQPDICDKCSGKLTHRADDTEETVRKRLNVYAEQTEPLVEYYKQQKKLHRINAVGEIDDIYQQLNQVIEKF